MTRTGPLGGGSAPRRRSATAADGFPCRIAVSDPDIDELLDRAMSIGAIGGRHAQPRLEGRYDGDVARDIALYADRRMRENGRPRGRPPYPTGSAGQLAACGANVEASVAVAARDGPGIGMDAERGKRAQKLLDKCAVGGVYGHAAGRCAFIPADVEDTRPVHDSRSARRAEIDRPTFGGGQFRGPLEAAFSGPSRGDDETRSVDPQPRPCLAPVPFERHIEEPVLVRQAFMALRALTGFDRTTRGDRVRERSDQGRRRGHWFSRSARPIGRGLVLPPRAPRCAMFRSPEQPTRGWSSRP